MSKESTKAALERFSQRKLDEHEKSLGPKRHNEKPEFELTKKPCKRWFDRNGWSMHIVESRAVWNVDAQAYISGQAESGFTDSVGCTPDGISAWVEFKAPKRRSTLKPHQRAFIIDKIQKGCFAVCVDSVECLEKAWVEFSKIRAVNIALAVSFLLAHLPSEPVNRKQSPLDGLPF